MQNNLKLSWLEAGRGIAAFIVLLSHSYALDSAPNFLLFFGVWGKLGVAFFFILSGFIICHAHNNDLDQSGRAINFAYRRWLRIFPTYWLVLGGAIGIRQLLGNSDYRISIDMSFVANQVFLLTPTPFVDVAWTLRHEIIFYSVFLIAILNFRSGVVIFCLWLALILYSLDWGNPCNLITAGTVRCEVVKGQSIPIVLGHLNLYFFVGISIWIARSRGVLVKVTASLAILSVVFFLLDVVFDTVYLFAAKQFVGCSAVFCLAVALSDLGVKAPKVLVWLGAVSYPLYLVHLPIYFVAHGIMKRLPMVPPPIWLSEIVIVLVLSLGVSWIIASRVEKPLFRFMRRSPAGKPAFTGKSSEP